MRIEFPTRLRGKPRKHNERITQIYDVRKTMSDIDEHVEAELRRRLAHAKLDREWTLSELETIDLVRTEYWVDRGINENTFGIMLAPAFKATVSCVVRPGKDKVVTLDALPSQILVPSADQRNLWDSTVYGPRPSRGEAIFYIIKRGTPGGAS